MTVLYSPVPHLYSFIDWKELPILAGTISREYDFTPGRDRAKKKAFLRSLSLDLDRMIFPKQVHGSTVLIVDESSAVYQKADALITDKKNVPIAIVTADCVPIFIYAGQRSVIAIIHAGWKGLRDGIITETLGRMQAVFQVRPEYLAVGIGPAIRACCYEVRCDLLHQFPADFRFARAEKHYLDLVAIAISQLRDSGVHLSNIIDPKRCTACESDLFSSYRTEGVEAGRMASFIMLR